MRLIDADRLMSHLSDWALYDNATEIRECMKAVKEQPTVDKINICKNCRWARLAAGFEKHGRWIDITESFKTRLPKTTRTDEDEYVTIRNYISTYKCSVCHTVFQRDYKYCPNCGAYMMEDYKNE